MLFLLIPLGFIGILAWLLWHALGVADFNGGRLGDKRHLTHRARPRRRRVGVLGPAAPAAAARSGVLCTGLWRDRCRSKNYQSKTCRKKSRAGGCFNRLRCGWPRCCWGRWPGGDCPRRPDPDAGKLRVIGGGRGAGRLHAHHHAERADNSRGRGRDKRRGSGGRHGCRHTDCRAAFAVPRHQLN